MEKADVKDLPFQHLLTDVIEEQYRKICYLNWRDEPAFKKDGIPNDSEESKKTHESIGESGNICRRLFPSFFDEFSNQVSFQNNLLHIFQHTKL